MHTILIQIEGGVIHNVEGIPEGVRVQIDDYDIEGLDPDRITVDGDGREVCRSIHDAFPYTDGGPQ